MMDFIVNNDMALDEIFVILIGDSAITAVFEPICEIPSTITEDFYLLEACSPYIINEDIIVDTGALFYDHQT